MSKNLTQRAIKEAFLALLNQRPLDKITVKDIVEACGVNRNTFYYHYQDIYDLLEEILLEETRQAMETGGSWDEGFRRAIRFALENRRAIYHIYRSVSRDRLEQYLQAVAGELVGAYVREQAQGLAVSREDLYYITIVYKHAVVGLVLEWLRRGMETEAETVIARVQRLFTGSIRHMLETASQGAEPPKPDKTTPDA